MKKTKLVGISASIVLLGLSLSAALHKKGLVEKRDYGYINWSKWELRASGEARFNQHQITAPHRKEKARQKARQSARRHLYGLFLDIRVDRANTLRDIIKRDSHLHNRLQNWFASAIDTATPLNVQGKLGRVELRLNLRNNAGLFAALSSLYPLQHSLPVVGITNFVYHHSGVVVDARHLSNFQPATGSRLYMETAEKDSRIFYSPEYVKRSTYRKQGHILYVASPEDKRIEARAGRNYRFIRAKRTLPDIPGTSKENTKRASGQDPRLIREAQRKTQLYASDLELFENDAKALLVSPKTRRALQNGRVVIICRFSGAPTE